MKPINRPELEYMQEGNDSVVVRAVVWDNIGPEVARFRISETLTLDEAFGAAEAFTSVYHSLPGGMNYKEAPKQCCSDCKEIIVNLLKEITK